MFIKEAIQQIVLEMESEVEQFTWDNIDGENLKESIKDWQERLEKIIGKEKGDKE